MRRKIVGLLAVMMLVASAAMAQPVPNPPQDPCLWANKQSVTKSISSATTTALVTPIANDSIYVCSYQIAHPGGTGTMALEYGTGTACATGATVIRGAFAYNTTAGTSTLDDWPLTEMTGLLVPASNGLCALSTGVITQVVTVSYVQIGPI